MDSENKNTIFARNLKHLRKKKGLTQYDLADLTGISKRMICHYETHAVEPPIENIEKIAKALKVKMAAFFQDGNETEEIDPSDFDMRSLKKLRDILSLSNNDRADLYRMLNKMLRKNQLEKERSTITASNAEKAS
jgi:transcriptional regulator with XRE-family HTH domain